MIGQKSKHLPLVVHLVFKNLYLTPGVYVSTNRGIIVCKIDKQTFTSEFEPHWVPHSHGLFDRTLAE